jgi:hypothetical protein
MVFVPEIRYEWDHWTVGRLVSMRSLAAPSGRRWLIQIDVFLTELVVSMGVLMLCQILPGLYLVAHPVGLQCKGERRLRLGS